MPGRRPRSSRSRRSRRRLNSSGRADGFKFLSGHSALAVLSPNIRQQTFTVHKWSSPVEILQTSADSFGTIGMKLNDLAEATSFQTIFQQYRFRMVEVFFRPVYRANPASLGAAYIMPLIYVAVDTSDGSSWTTTNQARSNDNVVITGDNEPFMMRFRPQIQVEVYNGGASTAGVGDMWLSTDDTMVRHYGVKFAITGSAALVEFQSYIVDYRATVEFRLGQ